MMHLSSTVTGKGQATIPKAIRERLGVHAGDRIAFRTRNGRVEIVRVSPLDVEFAKAQESGLEQEWLAEEDEAAYGDL